MASPPIFPTGRNAYRSASTALTDLAWRAPTANTASCAGAGWRKSDGPSLAATADIAELEQRLLAGFRRLPNEIVRMQYSQVRHLDEIALQDSLQQVPLPGLE
jgi:hypothetical protein